MKIKLNNEINEIIVYAKEEALKNGNKKINVDHIILGIIRHEDNNAYKILQHTNISIHYIKESLIGKLDTGHSIPYMDADDITFDPNVHSAIKSMILESSIIEEEDPGAMFLLLGIIKTGKGHFCQIMQENHLDFHYFNSKVLTIVGEEKKRRVKDELVGDTFDEEEVKMEKEKNINTNKANSILYKYGFDLTKAAKEGKLDPISGRENEINRLAQILGRRKKNNPVLIGEPGCGKSAIAEGLAQRIVQKKTSIALRDKKIISLEIGALVSGTKFRGQFEERMSKLIKEVKGNPDVILFIDELHTLVGAGGGPGSLDAANMLKPALARGEIQCIGATTLDEYREIIEKDGALERRFQKIMVEPTDFEETLNILKSIKSKYEKHHSVSYSDDALISCITLSNRYISDRCLPDKAIDLMDEAGSKAHLANMFIPKNLTKLENELDLVLDKKRKLISIKNFIEAAQYREVENKIRVKIKNEKIKEKKKSNTSNYIVTPEDIASILATMTKIPVNRIALSESNKLLSMDKKLKKQVIGQDDAIDKLVKAIRRNRAGLKDPNKPIGVFLFLGPTGVGKTYLAKKLAEYMFDSADNMIRIDMSEYMEKFAVSRLIGAPPGYVGYQEGGQLSERVRRKPYSVVLLDEVEKAHPDIFNLLLQVFDEGRLTDSNGRFIDFRNTIIIMTSNIGSHEIQDFGSGIGFPTSTKNNESSQNKSIIEKALNRTFSPEFINRFDERILFNTLGHDEIFKIITLELKSLKRRLEDTGFTFTLSRKARNFIIQKGYDKRYGARPLQRAIQKYIEDPLSEAIIGGISKDQKLVIDLNKKKDNTVVIPKKITVEV